MAAPTGTAGLTDVQLSERNRKADIAYEQEMAKARLAKSNPKRVPYPQAVKAALAAFDKVIAGYRS